MQKIGLDYDSLKIGQDLGTSINYVSKASIADYATATEDHDPIYFDLEDAQMAGYENIVAPAGFHLQYTPMKWATGQSGYLPQGAVHVRQQYSLFGPVYVGDWLTTTVSVAEKYQKKGRNHVVYRLHITNQHGNAVCLANLTVWLP